MTLTALLLALGLGVVPQDGPSYKIGGDTVPVQIPTWTGARPYRIAQGPGGRYAFLDGQLLGKASSGFEWSDLPPVPTGVSSTKQRVLVNVVARTDTMFKTEAWQQVPGTIYSEDMRAIKREVALFCHLVHAMSGGKVDVEPTWRLDETLRFVDHPSDLGTNYLAPFVNATSAKPSEGLGPFDSILLLTPLFSREIHSMRLDGTPVASLPMYAYFDRVRPGQLARAMYNAWLASPSGTTLAFSNPIGAGPLPLLNAEDWQGMSDEPAPAGPSDRAVRTSGDGVAVRPEFATWFAQATGRQAVRKSGGWVHFPGPLPAGSDEDVFKAQPANPETPTDKETAFGPGQAEKLPIGGTFAIKTSTDPDRGSVGELKEMSIRRAGWVRILGAFDGEALPMVQFSIKPRGAMLPLDLVVIGDGKQARFRMFGWSRGSGAVVPEDGKVLDLSAEPSWQQVRVAHGIRRVEGVFLATPESTREAFTEALPSAFLDDAAALGGSAEVSQVIPAVTKDDVWEEAKLMASTSDTDVLLRGLSSKSGLVQLNAALRFAEIQLPAAVPGLALVARDYNPRLAAAGARALIKQGTPDAIAALRYNFQNALGDFVKEFTAEVLPPVDERKVLSELSLALNARRPEARAAAARCLGRQPFKEASMVLLAFLNDKEPVVRAAALAAVPERTNVTFPRVLGAARNDPSDFVRAAAFAKLKEWNAPEAAEQAKDPSPRVRG